jgi:hypothetical protein
MNRISITALVCPLTPCQSTPIKSSGPQVQATENIFTNGVIYTINTNGLVAQAMVTCDGKIVFVGQNTDVERFVGPNTKMCGRNGGMIEPGLAQKNLLPSEFLSL